MNSDGHPTDAYELGREAVARLKEQNEQLSYELPNALETLFSDADFQQAIVVSGVVTTERQALFPVASYTLQCTEDVGVGVLTRRQHQQRMSPSGSSTPTRSKHQSPSILPAKSPPVASSTNSSQKIITVRVPCLQYVSHTDNDSTRSLPHHTFTDDPLKLRQNVSNVFEGETMMDVVQPESESKDTNTTTNSEDTADDNTCISCDKGIPEKYIGVEIAPDELQKQSLLRDLLWGALGMNKFYDRSQTNFPFCNNCEIKLSKLLEICRQIQQLENEFDSVRDDICQGIVSKNIKMMKQADKLNMPQLEHLKTKIFSRMKSNYGDISPGGKLIDSSSGFDISDDKNKPNEESSVENDQNVGNDDSVAPNVSNQKYGKKDFECRFCDKIYSNSKSRIYHEQTHRNNEMVKCEVCDKQLRRSTLKSHMKLHDAGVANRGLKCSLCDKIFSTKANLDEHLLRHKGIRPLHCTICPDQSYFRMKHMNAHFRKRHPGKDPKQFTRKVKPPVILQ